MTKEEAKPAGEMSLMEHLVELRTRLFICFAAVGVCAVVVFFFFPPILEFMEAPYRRITANQGQCPDEGCSLIATDPLAPFMVRIKVSVYGGMALALPIVMWEIWRFVVPALHSKERKYAIPFILSAVTLFAMGAVFAWYTTEKALQFLLYGSVGGEIQAAVTADKYLTLITLMVLAFGISFEFPLLLTFLLIANVVNTRQLRENRRWALVGITAFAAIITPSADPISLLFLAVPLYIFYEMVIIIGRVMKK